MHKITLASPLSLHADGQIWLSLIWHYQHMLKATIAVKTIETDAVLRLREILRRVHTLKSPEFRLNNTLNGREVDILVKLKIGAKRHVLMCEVKSSGQPRLVSSSLLALRKLRTRDVTPVLIAPFLSEEARGLCLDEKVSFLDLHGNAHITFDSVFIECRTAGKPTAERRELRSLFSPKSARVLSVLLKNPSQSWRVTDLATAAHISLGHVSNVRTVLLGRGWAEVSAGGLQLARPNELLSEWRDHYKPPKGEQFQFYTTLHGNALEESIRGLLRGGDANERAVCASFSAAQWLTPYARVPIQHFYADRSAIKKLSQKMKLTSTAKGENVRIITPEDESVFLDVSEPSEGIVCTSPVRTYLDLYSSGERGQEAAEFLRRERLKWSA